MARIETWVNCDLKKIIQVQQLKGNVFTLDNLGNLIGVRVFSDGEPVTLAGSVTGYCILADGTTVPVTGNREENRAYIILPQSAYAVPGVIKILIKMTEGSAITTLAALIGTVSRSRTDTMITPSEQVITDWAQAINASLAENTAIVNQSVKFGVAQSLTNAQKETARENIGAAGEDEVTDLKSAIIEIDSALYDTTYNKPLERVTAEKNASNYWVAYIPISNLVANKTYILYSKDIESGTYTLLYFDSSYNDHGSAGNVVFSNHYATFSVVPNSRNIYVRLVFGNSSIYSDASCVVYIPNSDGVFRAIELAKEVNKYTPISFAKTSGVFLNSSGGETSTTSPYYVTEVISVSAGEEYRIQSSNVGPVAYLYALYNNTTLYEIGTKGTGATETFTEDYVVIIPTGVNKLKVCYYGNNLCKIGKATKETTQNAIDEIRDRIDQNMFDPLYGHTLIGLGDSLMSDYYCGAGNDWLHLIGARHNMTVYNHAISGNPISGQGGMADRYSSMENAEDAYIIVMGGANDYNNNAPIGINSDNTIDTFKGALNVLINGLITKYPTGKIIFCTNYRRANTADEKKYVDAMLEICALYSVPCHNNYDFSNVYFFNHSWMDEYGAEAGVYTNRHLNAKGDIRVSTMYEALLSKL